MAGFGGAEAFASVSLLPLSLSLSPPLLGFVELALEMTTTRTRRRRTTRRRKNGGNKSIIIITERVLMGRHDEGGGGGGLDRGWAEFSHTVWAQWRPMPAPQTMFAEANSGF